MHPHRQPPATAIVTACLLALAMAGPADGAPGDATATLARAEAQVRIDPEASRRLAEQALVMLADAPDPGAQAQAQLLLCEHHAERDRTEARRRLDAARTLLASAARAGLHARALACEAELMESGGDGAGALALYEQSVLSAERADDRAQLAQSLFQRGYLRGVRGEFANGLSDLKRAAALFEALDMQAHLTTVYNGLAILHNRMGDAAQARSLYERALRQQESDGLERELVVTWHNLGRVNETLGDWPAAEQAFGKSLALARKLGYARGQSYALRGLAAATNAAGRPAQALEQLGQSAAAQQGLPDERLRGQIQLQRGIAMVTLGRRSEAKAALDTALAIFERAESPAEVALAHRALARLHADQGDWRAAYRALEGQYAVSDRLLRRQIDERVAALKLETDAAARETELRLLRREQEATARALEQERVAGQLRTTTLALGAVLAAVLAMLAWRLRRTGLAMRNLAHTDDLTGLPNRRDLLSRLEARLAAAGRCAVLIVDLDHFKRVNDVHGHAAGDAVLRAAADVLRDAARSPVAIGRLGGEEFAILIPDADASAARTLGERLRAAIAQMAPMQAHPELRLTASIGAALSRPGEASSDLLRRADHALYAAKSSGRNRVELAAE
jgi:diguanylate cyclase (GGDEF)-like protein